MEFSKLLPLRVLFCRFIEKFYIPSLMTIWFSFCLVSGLIILSTGLSFVDDRLKWAPSDQMRISVLVSTVGILLFLSKRQALPADARGW